MTNCIPIVLRGNDRERFTVRVEIVGPSTGEVYTLMLGEPGVYAPRLLERHEEVDAELARLLAAVASVAATGAHVRGFLYATRGAEGRKRYSISIGLKAAADPAPMNLILVDRVVEAHELLPRHFMSEKEAEAHSAELIDALSGGKFSWETSKITPQPR